MTHGKGQAGWTYETGSEGRPCLFPILVVLNPTFADNPQRIARSEGPTSLPPPMRTGVLAKTFSPQAIARSGQGPLVRVQHLWLPPFQRLGQVLDAEASLQGVGQLSRHHVAAVPVHDCHTGRGIPGLHSGGMPRCNR